MNISTTLGSSNPSTRRKIENGSVEIRKKLGLKKAEKSYCFSFAVLIEAINILRIVPH